MGRRTVQVPCARCGHFRSFHGITLGRCQAFGCNVHHGDPCPGYVTSLACPQAKAQGEEVKKEESPA